MFRSTYSNRRRSLRKVAVVGSWASACVLVWCLSLGQLIAQDADDRAEAAGLVRGSVTDLLDGPFDQNWKCFSSKKVKPGKVWRVMSFGGERQLICSGDPKGFLYTEKSFTNFELTFEWMYPSDPNGNSGVLVYTRKEPRLWPTSMQVQLHQPQAGAIFATGDATSDKPFDAGLASHVGKWNKCRIVSIDGKLTVEINDQKAGRAEDCTPSTGRIALQSEGSVTYFRRLRLTELLLPKKETEGSTAVRKPSNGESQAAPAADRS